MKIIKVVVDELPDNCNGCKYYDRWLEYCHIVNKGYSDSHIRPDWCPLERDKEIVNQEYYRKFYADQQALTELYRKAESEE